MKRKEGREISVHAKSYTKSYANEVAPGYERVINCLVFRVFSFFEMVFFQGSFFQNLFVLGKFVLET